MIRGVAVAAGALLLAGCSTPHWTTPHRFPLDPARGFASVAPDGWGTYWVADGMVASLHGSVFEQIVAGSIPLSSRQVRAIEAAATPALAAAEVQRAMVDGEAWWWFPGWRSLAKPGFTVTDARTEPLSGHPGVSFDGQIDFDAPATAMPVFRVRTRAAVVGDRLHFVALSGIRRVYFDAAVPAFDAAVGRFRIDAGSGSR